MVSGFVATAQKRCGRRGDTLLNTLMAQVKKYLEQSHSRLRAKLEHSLTHEGWGEAQILPSHMATLQTIMDHAQGTRKASNGATHSKESNTASALPGVPLKCLRFQDENFHVPNCLLELLSAIETHLRCTEDFSAHVITIMHQIVELLGYFNKRATELILGTGALNLYVCFRKPR